MIISELRLYDFRQFKSVNRKPGLDIRFHRGLNALVGENDSGKTTVIDALKLVLLTQSGEYIHATEDDFYMEDGKPVREFRIECVLSDFDANEAKNFVEYLTIGKEGDGYPCSLHLHYRAWTEGESHRVFTELLAGDTDGVRLDGRARELLKAVYLKPLRDAEREMSAGRRSRLSQVLLNHRAFKSRENHPLVEAFREANKKIDDYFTSNDSGKEVMSSVKKNLSAFHESGDKRKARIEASDMQLRSILESLSLTAGEAGPGLGELNLMFMAAELLLLGNISEGGLRVALVEEIEAHLHPQVQLRLIEFLQGEYEESGAQVIITTHSPVLASKINLKSLILMKGGRGYDLAEENTLLMKSDYLFLQRFLDATKANLFFAKGIIMVEGDAENILLPTLADIVGYPLEKNGVSIVNVGSTAFLRYSRILARADGDTIDVPVSVVTDCDVVPEYVTDSADGTCHFDDKSTELKEKISKKKDKYTVGSVRAFVSPRWTLEYCIATSCLSGRFHRAINYAKKVRSLDGNPLDAKRIAEADARTKTEEASYDTLPIEERAHEIYGLMLNQSGKSGLKSIVAHCLASMLRWEVSQIPEGFGKERMFDIKLYGLRRDEEKALKLRKELEADSYLRYLIDAIRYASGASPLTEEANG